MRARGTNLRRNYTPALRGRAARGLAAALALALAALAPVTPALAFWNSLGIGAGMSTTGELDPPSDVVASSTGAVNVDVTWTASSGPSPVAYYVVRTGDDGDEAACGTTPSILVTGTTCADEVLTAGTYTYRVVAVHNTWTATSTPSDPVTVADPTFLGAAASFSVLGVDATNTAISTVSGDIGVSPIGAIVNFPPEIVGGDIHLNDARSAAAAAALLTAYDEAASMPFDTEFPGDPNGLTFEPGVHRTIGAMTMTGTVTLDALGDPDAIFIFQINGAITTAANSHIVLEGGAVASNVYWQVNGASGHGANSTFSGTIMALGAITLGDTTELIGRALSQAAVTLGGTVIRFTIAGSPTVAIDNGAVLAVKDTTPTISGTTSALPGRPVLVTVGSQLLSTTVLGDQTWSVTAAELLAGTYPVVVKIRDAAGNGGTATQQLTIEVNPPTIELGAASPYSVLTGANIVGTGTSTLSGELGVTPGTSVTGFPPGTSAAEHLGDAAAEAAAVDANAAFADGSSRVQHTEFVDPSNQTFHIGVHHVSAAVVLTGTITLDAEGDPDAIFIFQIDGALTTAAGSAVILDNGAQASNVFWIVQAAVGTGANSSFAGTIITQQAVTLGNLATLDGRVLAGGTVTLANNTIVGP